MNRLEVELTKLRKTAKRTATRLGLDDGMLSVSCVSNTLHVTVWVDGDIVNSKSEVIPSTKNVKQTVQELVREYKRNSQS